MSDQAPVSAHVDLQVARGSDDVPPLASFRRWVSAATRGRLDEAEVSVRVVGAVEGRRLNQAYRGKDRPTNVLAFPAELPADIGLSMLGDLVICAEVVTAEAAEQGKAVEAHWAHLVVHGTLHLMGFDHQTEAEASAMERAEIQILDALGYPDPYNFDADSGDRQGSVYETGSDDV